MEAIQVVNWGQPCELAKDVPIPKPGKGQLLVKVKYAAINPLDAKIIKYNVFKAPLPHITGFDVSGTVTAVGEGVTRFVVGDEIHGSGFGGGFAQYALVPEPWAAKHVNMPADVAAATSVVFATAWNPLYIVDNLDKRKGQTIFIAGGGGGIGHIAIQLAKRSGLTVITSAGKPESLKLAKDSGADHVIDYSKTKDVVEEIKKLTKNNEGVDIAFDPTYQTVSHTQSAKAVKKGGKWIRVGAEWNQGASDEEARAYCDQNGISYALGDLGRYWNPQHPSLHDVAEMFEKADQLYGEGVRVHVGKVVPWDAKAFNEAQTMSEQGKLFGKAVVKVQ